MRTWCEVRIFAWHRAQFFTNFWLHVRFRFQKKNAESCRCQLRVRYHLWCKICL